LEKELFVRDFPLAALKPPAYSFAWGTHILLCVSYREGALQSEGIHSGSVVQTSDLSTEPIVVFISVGREQSGNKEH